MATEQILISLKLDMASRDRIEKALTAFRTKAKKLLDFAVTIRKGDTEKELKKVVDAINKYRPKIQKALTFTVSIKTDNQMMATLQSALNTMSQSIANFNINTKYLSSGLKKAASSIFNMSNASTRFAAVHQKAADSTKEFGRATDGVTSSFFGFLAAAAIGKTVVGTLLNNFVEFETRLIRVGRLVGLDGQAMFDFGQQLNKVANETGMATNAVIELAEAGAKLGVKKDDLVAFTEQVSKISIALQITGVEAAEAFRSLSLLFQLPLSNIINMANAMNGVADASAISAQGLQGVVTYIAPVLNQFEVLGKRGVAAAAALGAVLVELGVSGEVAGSGVQKLLNGIKLNAPEAARAAGMPVEQFKKLIELDVIEALGRFTQGFVKLDIASQASTKQLLKLNNIRVERVLTLLGNNFDRVREKQALASAEFTDGISVLNEAARQAESLGSEIQKLKNYFAELGREAFKPFKAELISLGLYIKKVVDENRELVVWFAKLVVAGSAVLGVIGSVSVVVFALFQALSVLKTQVILAFKFLWFFPGLLLKIVPLVKLLTVNTTLLALSFTKASYAFSLFATKLKLAAVIGRASAGVIAGVFAAAIAAVILLVEHFISALGQGGSALEIFDRFLKIVGSGFYALLKGINDFIAGLFRLKLDFSGFSLGDSIGELTALDKLLGKFLFGAKEYAHGLDILKKSTKDAVDSQGDFGESLEAAKARLATMTDPLQRAVLFTNSFAYTIEAHINKLLLEFDKVGGGFENFGNIYKNAYASLYDDLNYLFVNGAQGFREVLVNNLRAIESEFGKSKAAAKLATITQAIDENLDDASKIRFTGNLDDYERALERVNDLIKNQGVNYELGGEAGGKAALRLITEFQGVRQVMDLNVDSVLKYVSGIDKLSVVQGISADRAKELTVEFIKAGTTIEKFTDQSTAFGRAIQFALGKENLTQNLDDLTKDIVDFGDTVVKMAQKFDLGTIMKPKDTIEAIQFLNKLTAEQVILFTKEIGKQKESLKIQLLIADAKENAARRDEGGLKSIDDRITKYKIALKYLNEINEASSTIEQRQNIANVEAEITDLMKERQKHVEKVKDESKELEASALKISKYIRDGSMAMEQQSEDMTAINEKVEDMKVKENDIVDALVKQAKSAEDIVKLRLAGLSKIAAEEYKIRKAAFDTVQQTYDKLQDSLRKLRESGDEFLARFELKLEPSEIVREIKRLELEFKEKAAEGSFVGKEAEAKEKLVAQINRLQKKAQEERAKEEDKLGDSREDKLKELYKQQRKFNNKIVTAAEEAQAVSDKRAELKREGFRGQELDNELSDFRAGIQEERDSLLDSIADTQKEIAEIDSESAKNSKERVAENAAIATELKGAGTFLDESFAEGQKKVEEMKKEAEEAGRALKDAAASLQEAALTLKSVFSPETVSTLLQNLRAKEEAAAKESIESIDDSIRKTDKVGDIWNKLVEQVNVLANQIKDPKIDVEAANREKLRLAAIKSAEAKLETARKEQKSEEEIGKILEEISALRKKRTEKNAQAYYDLQEYEGIVSRDKQKILEAAALEFEKAGKEGATLPADWLEMVETFINSVQIGQGITRTTQVASKKFEQALSDVIGLMVEKINSITENLESDLDALAKASKKLVDTATANKIEEAKKVASGTATANEKEVEAEAKVEEKNTSIFKKDSDKRQFIKLLRDKLEAHLDKLSAGDELSSDIAAVAYEDIARSVEKFIESRKDLTDEQKNSLRLLSNRVIESANNAAEEAYEFNADETVESLDVKFAAFKEGFATLNNVLRLLSNQKEIDTDALADLEKGIDKAAGDNAYDKLRDFATRKIYGATQTPATVETEEQIRNRKSNAAVGEAINDIIAPKDAAPATEESQEEMLKGLTQVGTLIAGMKEGVVGTLNTVTATLSEPLIQLSDYTKQSLTETFNLQTLLASNNSLLTSINANILSLGASGKTGLGATGVGPALSDASEDLALLNGAQNQEAEAIGGLGDALGNYASLSAEKTAQLIAQANERTADVKAANEILKSTQLTT